MTEQYTTNRFEPARLDPTQAVLSALFHPVLLGFVSAIFLVSSAYAQTSETPQPRDLRRGVQDCATIQDSTARLACYDQLATDVNAAPNNFVVPIDRARVETLQRESFGFNLPDLSRLLPSLSSSQDEAPDVASLELQVDRITTRADGSATFHMGNGQIWTQVDPQRTYNVRVGDTVTVRRAALGSFMLIGTRGGPSHRVRREN